MPPDTDAVAEFIAGFVAAEGCFTGNGDRRFRFNVGLGATDSSSCDLIYTHFGVGSVKRYPRRKPHYDDEVQYTVQSARELVMVVVPFMDAHLPLSHKREQYLDWRARLLDHWRYRATCQIEGCDREAKAHGHCGNHLWIHRLRQ